MDSLTAASIAARETYLAAIRMHEAEAETAVHRFPDPTDYAAMMDAHRLAVAVLARAILTETREVQRNG